MYMEHIYVTHGFHLHHHVCDLEQKTLHTEFVYDETTTHLHYLSRVPIIHSGRRMVTSVETASSSKLITGA